MMKDYLFWLIGSLLCMHDYKYHHTIYGDEIIFRRYKRTCEVCTKCGRMRHK